MSLPADKQCSICQGPAEREWLTPKTIVEVTCRRCGRYQMTWSLNDWWKSVREKNNGKLKEPEERLLPYLSAHTRQASEPVTLGVDGPDWHELARGHMTTGVSQKLSRLLEYVAQRSEYPGAWVEFDETLESPLFDVGSSTEMQFLLNHLRDIVVEHQPETGNLRLTIEGWEAVAPIAGSGVPGTCFVAMAFDKSLDGAYEDGIRPAVETDCGFTVVRVDRVQYNGSVNDQILAGIRGAQFLVADVTLQRQGVYYEGGFAMGLPRTVIWSCRKNDLANVHFDTRQFNHVVWETQQDLRERLTARIRGTVSLPATLA